MSIRGRTALFVLGLVPVLAQGAVVGEVISVNDRKTAQQAIMSAANGSQFAEVTCGDSLTHSGSPRYFLGMRAVPDEYLPDGYLRSEMVAADEDCAASYVISDEPGMRFSTGRWSPDGRTMAVYATRWDLSTGGFVASGIYLADVVFLNSGSSRPVGIANLRLVIEADGETLFSWSGDGSRIAYRGPAPNGQGGTQADILIYNRLTGETANVTNTPTVHEDAPAFSPVDDRIAYQVQVAIKGTYRFDIFTIPAAGGVPKQITYKGTTGSPQNYFPCFSPDGQYLAYGSGSLSWPLVDFDVYKIRADGTGKAVNLTARRAGDFLGPVEWRR